MRLKKRYAAAAVLAAALGGWVAMEPSNTREWTPDNARAAYAEFRGDSVYVHNVRNAAYTTQHDYTVAWEDRAYDLRQARSAWFMVEPMAHGPPGLAHTLVSFGFDDGRYLAVSAEIRKEQGESFHPVKGLLNQFELTYVVADEHDVIGLRANYRKDPVYLYPVRAERAQVRAMLEDMLKRANQLREEPEFYNTVTNTCTTNIVHHVNRLAPDKVPLSYKVLLPGWADELAYDIGLIDTDLPFEQARQRYHVNARAAKYADAPDFSARIRTVE
jgi:hypothetical protein